MIRTGLDFAPGTTDDCKRLVAQLFSPEDILGSYRTARDQFGTPDIVLRGSESDPSGFLASPRQEYLATLRRALGHARASKMMPALGIAQQSAHKIAMLPAESDALWLVVERGADLPIMCVLFATRQKFEEVN